MQISTFAENAVNTTRKAIYSGFIILMITVFTIFSSLTARAQLTGTKNIPGDYVTLAAAITDLNTQGVGAGGVTLNLIASNPETAPAGGYVIGGTASLVLTSSSAANPVIITGNGNTITAYSPQASGNVTDAIFKLIGADFVTIQGFNMQENSSNVSNTVASNDKTEFGVALFYVTSSDGAQNNSIQNNTISLSANYQNAMGIYSSVASAESSPGTLAYASSNAGLNSNLKVYGNTISSVAYGITIVSPPIAAITDTGLDIGGNAPSTGNNITFGNNIAPDAAWGGFVAVPAGIYGRNPIGVNIRYNTITSNAMTISTYGVLTFPSIIPIAAVAYTNTVSNNSISLTQNGSGANGITGILFNYGNATATHICSNNTITLTHAATAATTGQITGISNAVQYLNSTMNGNTITINQSISGGAASGQIAGMYNYTATAVVPGSAQTINNNSITFQQNAPGTGGSFTNAVVYIMANNSSNAISLGTGTVNSNQLLTTSSTLRTSGSVFGIYHDYTYSTGITVNGNTINWDKAGAGAAYGIFASTAGSSAAVTVTNNNFTLTGTLTAGAVNVFNEQDGIGTTSTAKNINSNTVNITTPALAGAINLMLTNYASGNVSLNNFTVSSAGNILGTTFGTGGGSFTLNGNTFSLTSAGSGSSITGISALSISSGSYTITNNTFNTLAATAAVSSSPVITAIALSTGTANVISGNKILNATTGAGTGTAIITGITLGGGTLNSVFKNKISDLSTGNVGAASLVSGIRVTAGASTNNIYNNLIGNLTAPAVPSADAIRAINITATTASSSQNLYYNTIYLNAAGPATFGTTGIYHTSNATATTSKLDLRNNIVVNLSTPGTTAGVTSVLRRSAAATLGNYATTSNRNFYFAGTPASNRAILNENGTVYGNSASGFAFGPGGTAGTFQNYVTASREANSFSGETGFTYSAPGSFFISLTASSPDFLHIVNGATTRVESGGLTITTPSVTDDYDGQNRSSLPDIGADEFNGVTPAPAITNVTVPSATCTVSSHNINATITVPAGTITSVTLNYNNGAAGSTAMTLVSANVYNASIPAGTPGVSTTWSITAVSDASLSTTYTGTSYVDDPLTNFPVTTTASVNPVCSGSPTALSLAISASPAYTAPPAVSYPTTDEDLGNITITKGAATVLNNSTAINSLAGTIGSATGTAGSYSNFTGFGPYTLTPGQTYSFSASSLQSTTAYGNAIAIYIDYNRNGSFGDAGELVYNSAATTSGAHTETGSFTVPASASFGLTRMRIISNEGLITSPTQAVSYGEYEEYAINLTYDITAYSWSDGSTIIGTTNPLTVSPVANTTYTLTITALGCTKSSAALPVIVTPLPPAPSPNNSSQCGFGVPTAFVTTGGGGGAFRWYLVPTGGTALPGQSASTLSGYSISTTTTFYVSELNSSTGCESPRASVVANVISPDPVQASVNNNIPCNNTTIQLSVANTATTPANTYTYTWTASPSAGSGIPTNQGGSPISVTPTIANTYTYTVTAVDGSCTTTSSVTVTVKALPVIDSIRANPNAVCSGSSVQLKVYSGVLTMGPQTFPTYALPGTTNNAGGDHITLVNFSTINNVTTIGGTNGFVDYTTSLPPAAVTAGSSYSLTVHVANGGTEYAGVWFDWNRNGVYDATEFYNVPLTLATDYVGTITVNVPANAVAGNIGMRVRSEYLTALTSANAYSAYTYGETEEYKLNVTGAIPQNASYNYVWNPGALAGANITVNPVSTTVYTVTVTNPATTCSTMQPFSLTVYDLPAVPSATNSEQCGTQIPDAFVSSNSMAATPIFRWYNAATGGTLLQSGASSTYTTSVSTTTTFYVAEINGNGCESFPRAVVTVTVDPPDPIVAQSSSMSDCQNSSIDLTVTQALSNNTYDLSWTASPAAGSGIASSVPGTLSTPLTITPTVAGTYIYTVTGYDVDKGCTTTSSVTVTVHPQPSGVTAGSSASSVCTGSTVNLTSSAVSNVGHNFTPYTTDFETYPPVNWTFINAGSGNSWIASTGVTPAQPVHSGTKAMAYVRSTTSAANAWAITAGQPLIAGDTYTISFWYNTGSFGGTFPESLKVTVGTSNTVAAQTTVLYNNASLTNETYLQATVTYTALTTGTYYFGFNCYSAISENVLLIDDVSITGPTVEIPTYSWTSNPAGFTSNLQNPANVVVSVNTVYTVVAHNSFGCSSNPVSVSVSTLPLPNAPIGTNSQQCGSRVPTASVATGGGGGNGVFNWYATPSGGTALQSGTSSTYSTAISSTTTFYVSEGGTNSCESARTAVTVTVTTPPPAMITAQGPTTFCLNGGSVTLNGASGSDPSYTIFNWSVSPSSGGGLSSASGSTVMLSPTAAGTYTVTLTASDGVPVTGCTAVATLMITVNANPVIDSVRANPSTICGGSSTLKVYSSVLGAGPQTFPAYTLPGTTSNSSGDQITLVSFSTINNTSGTGGTNGFVDYTTTVPAPTVNAGASNTLTVHVANGGTEYAAAWFDWNRNGIYEASEFYNVPLTLGSPDYGGTITVTVPSNAAAGVIGLRVRSEYLTALTSSDAYSSYTFGETEEYKINVIGSTPQNPAFTYTWNPGGFSGSTVNVSPTVTTTYTPTVTNPPTGCSTVGTPITVTVTPVGANATANPSTPVCVGTSVTLNGGATGGAPFTYTWSSTPTGSYPATASITVSPSVTTTYTVTVADACANTTTSSVTVTVNPLPSAGIQEGPAPLAVCDPSTQVLTAVTDATSATYQWTMNGANISGATGATYTVSGVGTGTYRVIVTNTSTNCISAPSGAVIVTVNAKPSAVSITPAAATICNGGSVGLVASGGTIGGLTMALAEDFNNNAPNWTITNAGTSPAVSNWYYASAPYTDPAGSATFSNFSTMNGGKFALANSDAGGSGTTTNTVLTSPVFSLANYSSANLSFEQGFEVWSSGDATVALEISTNGGSTWSVLQSYLGSSQGTTTNNAQTTIAKTVSLTSYLGQSNLRIRYNYVSTWGFYWILDDVKVSGNSTIATSFTWSPATGLNTTSGTSVTASPSVSTIYTARATSPAGCFNETPVTVTVNPRPTGVISGSGTYCNGASTATALSIAVTGAGPWSGTLSDGTTFSGSTSPITVTVTPTATTTYTIATLNGSQCSAIAADLTGSATVTVNPTPVTPTVTPAGPVTQCGGTVILTASMPGMWQWNLNGSPIAGATNQAYTVSASGNYSVTVTNESGCAATSAATTVTINPVPATPTVTAGGPTTFCAGGSVTLTSSSATNNQWNLNGAAISGATNQTLVVTASGDYTVTVSNGFGCTATSAITTVTVNPLGANPTATVTQPTCTTATGTINVTSPLGSGNSYSLDGTTFQSSPSFPGELAGTYTVYVHNAAGCFSPATTNVTVNPQPFTPAAPVVTGIVNVCPYIGTGTQITYHATATGNGTTTFNWVIPPTLVTIVSGQGTSDLTLTFQNGFAAQNNKQIRVTATNQCGTSPLAIYYLVAQIPVTPNPIVGPTDACPLLGGPAVSYTIPKAVAAASYLWTVPSGASFTHPNGTGVNDTTILVTFTAAYATGSITVQSNNDCGVSGVRSITVTRTAPSQPNVISGPTNACPYITPNAAATYTVTAVPGVTYTWSASNGAIVTSAQGSNTASVSYPVGYSGGVVTVTANSGCGTSTPRNLTITTLNPAAPSNIDVVQTQFCGDAGGRVFTYAISVMPANATGIAWTIPAGAMLISGQNTTQITVSYPNTAVIGAVTVQATNPCANSVTRSVTVKLPACAAGFAGTVNGTNNTAVTKGEVKASKAAIVAGGSEALEVKIFPNPTVSDFKLEVLTSGTEEITVRVLDNEGRLYKNFKVMPYQTIALGAELKTGSYFVEVRQGKTVKTSKVIKF